MKIIKGSYRLTVLIGRLAFKMPRFVNGFTGRLYTFYQGLSMNRTEKAYCTADDVLFCPVYLSVAGIVNVMPRCHPVSQSVADAAWESAKKTRPFWWLVESKASSFGLLRDGRCVAIDYGSTTISQQERESGITPKLFPSID